MFRPIFGQDAVGDKDRLYSEQECGAALMVGLLFESGGQALKPIIRCTTGAVLESERKGA
jgi:hypothetical protein